MNEDSGGRTLAAFHNKRRNDLWCKAKYHDGPDDRGIATLCLAEQRTGHGSSFGWFWQMQRISYQQFHLTAEDIISKYKEQHHQIPTVSRLNPCGFILKSGREKCIGPFLRCRPVAHSLAVLLSIQCTTQSDETGCLYRDEPRLPGIQTKLASL